MRYIIYRFLKSTFSFFPILGKADSFSSNSE